VLLVFRYIDRSKVYYVNEMAAERLTTSRLFVTSCIEGRTDVDERWEKSHHYLLGLTERLTEKETHDVLNKAVEDAKQHEEICLGLLYAILTDAPGSSRYYDDLHLVCRDGFKFLFEQIVNNLLLEKYKRLHESCRKQLVWLVRQMVANGIHQVEGVVWSLLRNVVGGDVSAQNLWLAEQLCDMFRENRSFLEASQFLLANVVYTYLRLLEDHMGPAYAALRHKEVSLVVPLLRERFTDVMSVGRDLVRLLQNVARIPEIEAFWRDLLHNPASLAPGFAGVEQLLATRTSRRHLVYRLPPCAERQVLYLCGEVKFGAHKRYQDWFTRQYLHTPESHTLRCDLIRFIIRAIHPSNEALCSDVIPRWAVIGWLLSTCTSQVALANCKMALFYDWLHSSGDNIMNIEPGILVMYHSIKHHPMLTASLLDFLCRLIPHFHPSLQVQVRTGITSSLQQILDKRVIQSLEPLFDNPRMDVELKRLLRETFPQFCSHEDNSHLIGAATAPKMDLMAEAGLNFSPAALKNENSSPGNNAAHGYNNVDLDLLNNHHPSIEEDAAFSDDDEEHSHSYSNHDYSSTKDVKKNNSAPNNSLSINNSSNNFNRTKSKKVPVITNANEHSILSVPPTSNNAGSVIVNNNPILSSKPINGDEPASINDTSNVDTACSSLNLNSYSSVNAIISSNITRTKRSTNDDFTNLVNGYNNGDFAAKNESKKLAKSTSVDSLINKPIKTNMVRADDLSASVKQEKLVEEKEKLEEYFTNLESDMVELLRTFRTQQNNLKRCEQMQKVCDLVLSEDLDEAESENLAGALSILLDFSYNLDESLLPERVTNQLLESCLNKPLFILFETLLSTAEDNYRRRSLLTLLSGIYNDQPSLSYRLLFYIKAMWLRQADEEPLTIQIYQDFCKATGSKDFSGLIARDMEICSEQDPRVLCWILPHLYQNFPKQTKGVVELLHSVLKCMDYAQLYDLECLILQGTLTMFDNSHFPQILERSLEWETLEQMFLWQLARAHEIPSDCCIAALPRLKFTSHAKMGSEDIKPQEMHQEALSNILMMLRRESPSENLLKQLLTREFEATDPTVVSILQYWVQRYEDKMAKLIGVIVNSKPPATSASPPKRKRGGRGGGSPHVGLPRLLAHLDHLRLRCRQTNFFRLAPMQDALSAAFSAAGPGSGRRHAGLFALLQEEGRGKRGRAKPKRRRGGSDLEDDSSEEESEETPPRGKRQRKPRKTLVEEPDSEDDAAPPSRKRRKDVDSDSD